jgi:hypothetical protein
MVCCGSEPRTGLCGSKVGAVISAVDWIRVIMPQLRRGVTIVSLSGMHNAIAESACDSSGRIGPKDQMAMHWRDNVVERHRVCVKAKVQCNLTPNCRAPRFACEMQKVFFESLAADY